jgi:hypothetical protein
VGTPNPFFKVGRVFYNWSTIGLPIVEPRRETRDSQAGRGTLPTISQRIFRALRQTAQHMKAREQGLAFIDYTTAYPSVHRDKLAEELHKHNIKGQMWKHLVERFREVNIRVLHPHIPANALVKILRGLPEGSLLSQTLFGILVADLILQLKSQFPHCSITHRGTASWIGGFLYVDDLCLIATSETELQRMLQACQEWSEKSRIQINTDKTKIMGFHEEAAAKKLRTSPIGPTYNNVRVTVTYQTPFYILSSFPAASSYSTPLKEVDEFTYLGLTLDSKVSMKAELESTICKAHSGHMLLYGVTYTARGMKDTRNTLHDCPMRILTVWKACVLVHFLHNLRYFHLESQIVNLQKKLNSSLQRTLCIYGHHLALLIDTGIPPLALTQKVQLAQLHFRLSQRHPTSAPGILFHNAQPFTPHLPPASLDSTMQGHRSSRSPLSVS